MIAAHITKAGATLYAAKIRVTSLRMANRNPDFKMPVRSTQMTVRSIACAVTFRLGISPVVYAVTQRHKTGCSKLPRGICHGACGCSKPTCGICHGAWRLWHLSRRLWLLNHNGRLTLSENGYGARTRDEGGPWGIWGPSKTIGGRQLYLQSRSKSLGMTRSV